MEANFKNRNLPDIPKGGPCMTQIKVGFCRKDLTPEGSIALGGYGDDPKRMSEGVLDHIFGTCIAITDP